MQNIKNLMTLIDFVLLNVTQFLIFNTHFNIHFNIILSIMGIPY